MCTYGTDVIVTLPDWLATDRQNRTIALDSCIASAIQVLWSHKIETLGCYCGHGKEKSSVVVDNKYTEAEVQQIYDVLGHHKQWEVSQWKLMVMPEVKVRDVATTSTGGGTDD